LIKLLASSLSEHKKTQSIGGLGCMKNEGPTNEDNNRRA
jgi:hypothetical protein